jgi:SAM-dependent methyltransferase
MYAHEPPEWGEVYDAVFCGDADRAFYVGEAERSGGPALEIGCGTGRLLLPTAARGIEAWGIDSSRAMLDRLALKAERQGLSVTTQQADMRSFRLPCRFALITAPNRAFLHMQTTEDQIAALENFRHHLLPGGRLVLNFFHPTHAAIASEDHQRREMGTFALPDSGRVVHVTESVRRDRVNQLNHVTFHFEEVPEGRGDEAPASSSPHLDFEIPFTARWIYKAEFALLLRAAGFERWQVCGGFGGEPLVRDDQEMVWTAWAG